MYFSRTLHALCTLFVVVSSLAIEQRSKSCVAADVALVKHDVVGWGHLCTFYLAAPRTRSPIPGLGVDALLDACQCISDSISPTERARLNQSIEADSISETPIGSKCEASWVSSVKKDFRYPSAFCKFYAAYPRDLSPVPGLSVKAIQNACGCLTTKSLTLTTTKTKTSSSSKHSTSQSSSKKTKTSSSSQKTTFSSKKHTSSSTKKQTSHSLTSPHSPSTTTASSTKPSFSKPSSSSTIPRSSSSSDSLRSSSRLESSSIRSTFQITASVSKSFSSSSQQSAITTSIKTPTPITIPTSSSATLDAYDVITSQSLQPFCSEYLDYTIPVTTVTTTDITTLAISQTSFTTDVVSSTSTVIATEIDYYSTVTAATTITTSRAHPFAPRSRVSGGQTIPDALVSYDSGAISSGCSRAATSPPTSTITTQATQTFSVTVMLESTIVSTAVQTEFSTTTEEAVTTVTSTVSMGYPSQVVVNPGFETADSTGSYETPWVTSGNVGVQDSGTSFYQSYDGSEFMALLNEGEMTNSFSQSLTNIDVGTTYILSYYYYVPEFTDDASSPVCTLAVTLGSDLVDTLTITAPQYSYLQQTASWLASTASPTLLFSYSCTGAEPSSIETYTCMDLITLTIA